MIDMDKKHKRLKLACYSGNLSMAAVSNIPPILFITFRNLYGISYSQLGLLVLANFCTQLIVDLVFSFFSHKFDISKTIKTMPYLTAAGFLIYVLWAAVFPQYVYVGLLLGTVVFSASAGLGEVLISPVVAAIPADEPAREMSKLHSVYAWGTVAVVILSTLFILAFGGENWQILILLMMLIPVIGIILYHGADIPDIGTPERSSDALKLLKNKGLWLCVAGIFLSGSSECTMAQWCSGYLEQALRIPKLWGDIFGVALFAVMLGLGRSLYGKLGKNISRVLLLGSVGAFLCYITAAAFNIPVIGLAACAFTGFCTSMLWPGSLVVASDRFPKGGVFVFALMAAGGDMGASVGSQLVGFITDYAIVNPTVVHYAGIAGLSAEQLGMKLGILAGSVFPMLAVLVFFFIWKSEKKHLTE